MEPKVWGKYFWTTLHLAALGYPDVPSAEDKANYKQFFSNFWKVLPCYKCSVNYKRHLQELPIDDYLTDNLSLFQWTVDLHNIVNRELGKNEVSYEEAKERFARLARGEDNVFVSIDGGWDKILRTGTITIVFAIVFAGIYYALKPKIKMGRS
jgi:hypothetical protein